MLKVFGGLPAESPKRVSRTVQALFCARGKRVSHRARDCFGSLTPEARKHLLHPRQAVLGILAVLVVAQGRGIASLNSFSLSVQGGVGRTFGPLRSQTFFAAAVAFDIDFRKNFETELVAAFGDHEGNAHPKKHQNTKQEELAQTLLQKLCCNGHALDRATR